jgi:hypothetical protein
MVFNLFWPLCFLEKVLTAEFWKIGAETASWGLEIFGLENRRKSSQILNDDIYLPFFFLFILCQYHRNSF